jgi:hypothetical protein
MATKWTDIWGRRHGEADHIGWAGFVIAGIDPMLTGSNVSIGAPNRCIYVRAHTGAIITKIGVSVTVASGNVSVAAYANTGVGRAATPGTQLATSGAVACPAAGYREIALPNAVRVNAGDWLGLSVDNTTASFAAGSGPGANDIQLGVCLYQDTAHPAPATPASLSSGMRSLCLIGVP